MRYVNEGFARIILNRSGWVRAEYRGQTKRAWAMKFDLGRRGSAIGGLARIQWSPEGNRSHGDAYWKVTTSVATTHIRYMAEGEVRYLRK
jgi:hypothetical protein